MYCIRLQMSGEDYPFVEPRPSQPPAKVAYFEVVPRVGESVYMADSDLFYKVLDVLHEPLVIPHEGGTPQKVCPWSVVLILAEPNRRLNLT